MIALARKYRPRRFADLLVQDHVAAALQGAVAKGRVGHGYLLTGPRGVGKTTAARILAMALNCERRDPNNPTGEPCGECPTCDRIWSGGANLDVVEIDAASNRSVDDARELRERAMYAASQEGGYKVYIVDEAHMLTREAWNALLKILEEPPPRVVFVFATTEPQKIANNAAPVLSRLQRFDFRRIGAEAIRTRIKEVLTAENLSADEDAIAVIARYADGGMRDALSVLDQALSLAEGSLSADRVRQALGLISDEVYAEVLDAVAAKNGAAIFPVVDRLLASGADLVEFVGGMAELLRAVLMLGAGAQPEGLTAVQREVVGAAKDRLSVGDVLRMLALLSQAEVQVRRSSNPRLAVETLLLRWTLMDRTVDLEAVLAGEPGPTAPRLERRREGPVASATTVRGGASPDRPSAAPPRAAPIPASPAVASVQAEPIFVGATLEVAALQAGWAELVARARGRSPLLATVIESLSPVGVDENRIVLSVVGEDGAHMLEGAERQRRAIEQLLSTAAGRAITVTFGGGPEQSVVREKPKRLSEKDLRAEKLRDFRSRDAALDAAADALDLEIVD